jgi:hypothetical protein
MLDPFRIGFGQSGRHLATHGVPDRDDAINAKLIENRRHELRLPLDRVPRRRRLGPAVADQIEANDAVIGRELRRDVVPPIERRTEP